MTDQRAIEIAEQIQQKAVIFGTPDHPTRFLNLVAQSIIQQYGDERAAAARLDALEKMQWQPIETAPRDGTRVLLVTKYKLVCEAFYSTPEKHIKGGSPPQYGWCTSYNEDDPFYNSYEENPTHWMPLPTPPQDQPTEV